MTYSVEVSPDYKVTIGVPLSRFRAHDNFRQVLPGTASADDMGLNTGTPGTDAPTLRSVDFGGGSSDEKSGFEVLLPHNYQSGGPIVVRAHAGMLTTISDGTATLDCELWRDIGDGTVGSDLCATAAQSINSLTLADIDFSITTTTLIAGDRIICRLSFAGSDTGNAGVMVSTITRVQLLIDY